MSFSTELKGRRVRLIRCTDEFTRLEPGALGTVQFVDDANTLHVAWDSGSTLGLCDDADDVWDLLPESGWTVVCEDGLQRHAGAFERRALAENFAEWGHVCTRQHSITELDSIERATPCFVQISRAFQSPDVRFGPFDSVEAAQAWCRERDLAGAIWTLNPPSADTGPTSEVWR